MGRLQNEVNALRDWIQARDGGMTVAVREVSRSGGGGQISRI
jgi:hypothetical protein